MGIIGVNCLIAIDEINVCFDIDHLSNIYSCLLLTYIKVITQYANLLLTYALLPYNLFVEQVKLLYKKTTHL